MNNTELTPTERLALQIQDLNAQLQLKDEELFFAKAANARFKTLLFAMTSWAEALARFDGDLNQDGPVWSDIRKAKMALNNKDKKD